MTESAPPPQPEGSSAPIDGLLPADQLAGLELLLKSHVPAPSNLLGLRKRPAHWLPDEDERLNNAVKVHGTENWAAVARAVATRTRAQCAQRWHRGLNPTIDKSTWSFEEEQRLIDAVLTYGTKAWTRVAAALGNRSDVQCRWRYRFLVKKANAAQTTVQPISPHAEQTRAPE
jgi:hypothetical protein